MAEAEAPLGDHKFRVPITKAGDKENPAFLEITLSEIMDESFPGISLVKLIADGLKVHLNSRMSKITGEKTADSMAAAQEIAEANLANLREGKVNVVAAKEQKVPQAVRIEAERLAKAVVKAAIKAEGKVKVSHVPAKDITAAAKMLLAGDRGAGIYEMAKNNIEARLAAEKALQIDVSAIKADPILKAKQEAEAAKKKKATADKKAGKTVATRAKPKAAAHATAH